MVDSRNLDALREFFETYEGLTDGQLAIVANIATCTVTDWKRKCGKIKSDYKKPPKQAKGPIPDNWNNKEWFEKAYNEMGLRAIALLIGKNSNWKFVARKLKEYGISRKTLSERTASKNPCCDDGWLHYYYASRKDYLKWCKKEKLESCNDGGQCLSTIKCADLADVSPNTITNWLAHHKMIIRDRSDAQVDNTNSNKSILELRRMRDEYFKRYRAGTINMVIGNKRYSNGTRVDKTETVNKRFNTSIRGTSTRSQSSE